MSLNGLDNPAVLEAYQSTLTEAGGWFLLHYVSRDEVAVLSRGTGGVPEVRNAVDNYADASPLYGFLHYRRRKVVLSYLPEDLSRLVKARTTVQFQSVLDKFSPHDTVFSLSESTDLTESALSSACLLHAASGSITSSSSSLRRRRLMEITEDAEEHATDKDFQSKSPASDIPPHRPYSQRSDATTVAPPRTPSKLQQTTTSEHLQSPEETSVPEVSSTPSVTFDHSSDRSSSQRNELSSASSGSRRMSQSSRPSLASDYASAYTPKVKRGPRPSVDSSGRPRTAGNLSRSQEQRPVASLPAGVRSSSLRGPSPNNPSRPRSQGSTVAPSFSSKGTPSVPSLLVPPLSMPISRPHISAGAKSLSAVSSSGMSPEKERLMKALQQRKKQMEKRTEQSKQSQPSVERTTKQDDDKNKENVSYGDLHRDKGPADRTVNPHLEQSTGETESTSATDTRTEARSFAPPDHSKPDSTVDLVVSDSDGDQPSTTSPSNTTPTTTATTTTVTTLSVDQNNNDDNVDDNEGKGEEDTETPRALVFPESEETHTEQEATSAASGAAVADSECQDGPRSPSAVDGPLENKSRNAPENGIVVSPPEQSPNPQEVDAAVGAPETGPRPDTLSLPNFSSILIVSNGSDSQHDFPAPESSDPVRQHVSERKDKRKPFLEPIQVPTPEYSDDDNFSDDSFMEELKSATVQEAKPVSVGPLSPVCPNNGNDQITSPEAWKNSRAVSNPSATGEPEPSNLDAVAGGRSVSSTYPDSSDPMSPVLVARKVNVSSGISKRIKALEKFTGGRDGPAVSTPPNLVGSAASSFDTFRKRASISKPSGNSDSPSISRSASNSVDPPSSRASMSRNGSQSSLNPAQTTSSVSVTARIVRDSNAESLDASDPNTLNLHASPLAVEHETTEFPPSQNLTAESTMDNGEQRRPSTSSVGSGNQSLAATIPRSESRLSDSSQSKGEGDDKKGSRTSRLLHRMSSITSNSRKSFLGALSPPQSAKEDPAPSSEKGPEPAPEPEPKSEPKSEQPCEAPQAIDIGEVNVQFPDTLLWKRRFVRVDDQGYLVLAPANVDSTGRNMTKRYHLTEFRMPCLPDEDRQELPNSILLDFLDGSTLQCACESRQGQAAVLDSKSFTPIFDSRGC